MTPPSEKAQISLSIRPVWSESSLCAQWVANDPSFLHASSGARCLIHSWSNSSATSILLLLPSSFLPLSLPFCLSTPLLPFPSPFLPSPSFSRLPLISTVSLPPFFPPSRHAPRFILFRPVRRSVFIVVDKEHPILLGRFYYLLCSPVISWPEHDWKLRSA